jgi:hypothetical protein
MSATSIAATTPTIPSTRNAPGFPQLLHQLSSSGGLSTGTDSTQGRVEHREPRSRRPPSSRLRKKSGKARKAGQGWSATHDRIAFEWAITVPSATFSAGSFVSPVAARRSSREPFRRNGIGLP